MRNTSCKEISHQSHVNPITLTFTVVKSQRRIKKKFSEMYQDLLSYSNHAFRIYVTWGGILLIKVLSMAFLTVFHRVRKGAVANPEDINGVPKSEVKRDEDVERVRRAHLNDLENIPAFMFIALMYVYKFVVKMPINLSLVACD